MTGGKSTHCRLWPPERDQIIGTAPFSIRNGYSEQSWPCPRPGADVARELVGWLRACEPLDETLSEANGALTACQAISITRTGAAFERQQLRGRLER